MSKRLGAILALILLPACAAPAAAPGGAPLRRALLAAATPLPAVTELPACTPSPGPSVGPSAPGTGNTMVIIVGEVLDPAGQPLDGIVVRALSLDAAVPYLATATTFGGSWVINNLPAGAQVVVEARGAGFVTAPVLVKAERESRLKLTLRATPVLPPLGPEVAPPSPSPALPGTLSRGERES